MQTGKHSLSFNKTRIAPTPSGYLHLGNLFSFALTAAIAEQTHARIFLRIDDLDRERVTPDYVQDIFDTLNFMEIPWHEGPRDAKEFEQHHSQVHRMELYANALQQLKENNALFACNCSRKKIRENGDGESYSGNCISLSLPFEEKDTSWRLKTIEDQCVIHRFSDEAISAILPPAMQHVVIRKKDGFPAYQLSSVVDDLLYGIDLVVRGEDLWPSTIAQHCIANLLAPNRFKNISFYHHPLLTNDTQEKLSKSAGAQSIRHLRLQGKKPAEIYAQLALMLGIKEQVCDWRSLADAWHRSTSHQSINFAQANHFNT